MHPFSPVNHSPSLSILSSLATCVHTLPFHSDQPTNLIKTHFSNCWSNSPSALPCHHHAGLAQCLPVFGSHTGSSSAAEVCSFRVALCSEIESMRLFLSGSQRLQGGEKHAHCFPNAYSTTSSPTFLPSLLVVQPSLNNRNGPVLCQVLFPFFIAGILNLCHCFPSSKLAIPMAFFFFKLTLSAFKCIINGIKHIHIIVQPSPPSISRTLFSWQN